MRVPSLFLVLACLVVGIAPAATVGPYLYTAVESVLGPRTPTFSLAVWHGFNLPLIMSAVALVGGAVLYLALKGYLRHSPVGPPLLRRVNGRRLFEHGLVVLSLNGPGPPRRCSARTDCSLKCGSFFWRHSSRRWFRSISAASACDGRVRTSSIRRSRWSG